MSRQTKNELKGSLIIPVGWLFADLLLALAMLFLIANTVAPPSKAKNTPTPTPTIKPKPTPSPTPLVELNTSYYDICLPVDPTKLVPGPPDQGTVQAIKKLLKSDPFLRKPYRRAGLVIPYGGTQDLLGNDAQMGKAVASQVVKILMSLGKSDNFVFIGTAYHESLINIGVNYINLVELQIYLFVQSDFKGKAPAPPPALTCPSSS